MGGKSDRTDDGILFDSVWERKVYSMLKLLVPKEEIRRQVAFELSPGYWEGKKKIQSVKYTADFVVGNTHIDAKGHETTAFRMRRRLFEAKYQINLHTFKEEGSWERQVNRLQEILNTPNNISLCKPKK